MSFVQEVFRIRCVTRGINCIFIVLIPKIKQTQNFNNCHPICVHNFTYKLVGNIIVTKSWSVISKLISPNRGVVMEGRQIGENSMLAKDVVHQIKKHR